jgi:hypothetical protein
MNAMGAVKVAEAVLWQMLAFLAFFGIFGIFWHFWHFLAFLQKFWGVQKITM